MAKKNTTEKALEKQLQIITDFITQVGDITKGKPCIFRGENKDYGEISCTLYRSQKQTIEEIVKEEPQDIVNLLNFPAIEREIVKKAHSYFPDGTRNLRVLTELQHYGGKTTLIDFTKNMLIALFFACNGEPQEEGRIIWLATDDIDSAQDLYIENDKRDAASPKEENDNPLLLSPLSTSTRVTFQSSMFVHAPKGVLNKDVLNTDKNIIPIKQHKKHAYLQALQNHFGITKTAVFNDLQGFIANEDTLKTAQIYSDIALSCSKEGKYEEAIKYYSKALDIQAHNVDALIARGEAKSDLGHKIIHEQWKAIDREKNCKKSVDHREQEQGNTKAKKCYEDALQDYNEALAIQADNVDALIGRGYAKINLGHREREQGNTSAEKKHFEDARDDFSTGLHVSKKNKSLSEDKFNLYLPLISRAGVYKNLGKCEQTLGNYEKAKRYYEKAIQDRFESSDGPWGPYRDNAGYINDDLGVYEPLGDCERALGNYEKARDYYEKAQKIHLQTISNQQDSIKLFENLREEKRKAGDHEAVKSTEATLYSEKNNPFITEAMNRATALYEKLQQLH